jgi:hypothetical protein
MRLPNFFIVGAPKAGTTSLYQYLRQHPQVYMSPVKETHYFCSEVRPENFTAEERPRVLREAEAFKDYLRGDLRQERFGGLIAQWEDYVTLFRNATDEIAIGEATPLYLWSRTAARNIAARFPHAKIIISLRNPIDRAFSQYLHMVAVGATRRSLHEQIEADLSCRSTQIGAEWPFLEYGRYCEQIKRYLAEFPRSQIHISLYEELERTPAELLANLFRFLDVDSGFHADIAVRYNEPRIPRLARVTQLMKRSSWWPYLHKLAVGPFGAVLRRAMLRPRATLRMDPAARALLADYYREEITQLAQLLERDLRSWLAADG